MKKRRSNIDDFLEALVEVARKIAVMFGIMSDEGGRGHVLDDGSYDRFFVVGEEKFVDLNKFEIDVQKIEAYFEQMDNVYFGAGVPKDVIDLIGEVQEGAVNVGYRGALEEVRCESLEDIINFIKFLFKNCKNTR